MHGKAQAAQKQCVKAWAKVNLALDIVGKRPDGYHDIETVMHRIELADDIEVVRGGDRMTDGEPAIRVEVVGVAGMDVSDVPCGPGNIALRAAQAFLGCLERPGIGRKRDAGDGVDPVALPSASVSIRIRKRIPVGAGLGGGSADAAAVLVAMNQLWETPLNHEQLMAIGASIGADVPFCVANHGLGGSELQGPVPVHAAFAQGIGDRLTPLPGLRKVGLLLINPGYAVSTSDTYARWDAKYSRSARRDWRMARGRGSDRASARAIAEALSEGDRDDDSSIDLRRICSLMSNDLEPLVAEEHDQVVQLKRLLIQAGAVGALMSGSGPTVFGVYDSPDRAEAAAVVFESFVDDHGVRVIPTCTSAFEL